MKKENLFTFTRLEPIEKIEDEVVKEKLWTRI